MRVKTSEVQVPHAICLEEGVSSTLSARAASTCTFQPTLSGEIVTRKGLGLDLWQPTSEFWDKLLSNKQCSGSNATFECETWDS